MDHGDHGGHGGHDMGPQCSMNMLWNTQIIDTCIVFPSWHIGSNGQFVVSFFAIVALGIFYEYLRAFSTAFDRRLAASLTKGKSRSHSPASERASPARATEYEEAGLLSGRVRVNKVGYVTIPCFPPLYRVIRALLYGTTVFLSFFLMLVFMTYNAYLILATVAGAAIGHYIFGSHIDIEGGASKGMACH
ncbi:Ctr copper transporter [Coniophora puteana RWD-64-598 SS2]|uniref:Copper transport protein n=1 Tax=Coniophora puteana (strain RWD-64-598) TaxID=741705 RepID=A0A5M3MUK0_CONPW|nr:Ctr copper transporter [Coniophora puteana RWD-64-598 SS2]EIW82852.1 Ctr copper transporter [Coniophora puteana RWD-64-598 SS2]